MIRRAKNTDIDRINALLCQVLEVHAEARKDIFKSGGKKYTNDQLLQIIADNQKPIFVYTDESDKVVGYAFCVFVQHENDNILTNIKTLYIDDLCVDESERGKHIGRSLYEYVINYAKNNGCYNVTLNVWADNKKALGFYENLGLSKQKITMEYII